MNIQPTSYDGYKLLHDGCLALSDVEHNGMMVDEEYCRQQQKHLTRRIEHTEKRIERHEEVKRWKKKYKSQFNIDSDQQLADILFNEMGYESIHITKKGNPSVSQNSLEQLDIPMVKDLISLRRLKKSKNTYIANYIHETIRGFLHPFFHLHTVVTFRSSSSKINFQNQPVRIPEIAKIVRRAVIPRPGRMICEIDFSGAEVRVATCYHKDPNMIDEITNPDRDMHRDMAMECFILSIDEWTKETRYCGKNMFVFPQFYGDYFVRCAMSMWQAISNLKLKTKQGVPMFQHLKQKGISNYKKFEKHIQKIEENFWDKRFPVYAKWKEDHWEKYCETGYVDIITGFRCIGLMDKNDAINYPVQGASFHCLLWSLIRLNRWLKETGKKTCIIGQIHDSIVLDADPSEVNEVLAKANQIIMQTIRAIWPWIIVPLEVEVELTPVDGSWYMKSEVTETDFDCDCGNHWMYKKKHIEEGDFWLCPVCSNAYEMENC